MSDAFRVQRDGGDPATRHMLNQLRSTLAQERAYHERLAAFLEGLPKLTEHDLAALGEGDSPCPVCLTPFQALLAEEETAHAMDSPAHPVEDLGVTRLVQTCGHMFCRKDIRNWMREGRKTCPTCRRPFMEPDPNDHANEEFDSVLQSSNFFPLRLFDLGAPDLAWMVREGFGIPEGIVGEPQPAQSGGSTQAEPEGEPEHLDEDRSGFAGMYS